MAPQPLGVRTILRSDGISLQAKEHPRRGHGYMQIFHHAFLDLDVLVAECLSQAIETIDVKGAGWCDVLDAGYSPAKSEALIFAISGSLKTERNAARSRSMFSSSAATNRSRSLVALARPRRLSATAPTTLYLTPSRSSALETAMTVSSFTRGNI